MKKILGFALGIMMIALTPAVGNAAGMITATCKVDNNTFVFDFDISKRKQNLAAFGKSDVKFSEDAIIIKDKDDEIYSLNFKNKKVFVGGEWQGMTCEFKNLELIKQALLNQNKEPVSTSVQQRLQALEERMDRVESSMKK